MVEFNQNNPYLAENTNLESENTQEKSIKKVLLILVIIAAVALIILVGIQTYKRISPSSQVNNPENNLNENINNPAPSVLNERELGNCLEVSFTEECSTAFSNPDINNFCSELEGDTRDQCYLRSAISNYNPITCEDISNLELKTQCLAQFNTEQGLPPPPAE